jgi:hypothetical protein
LLSIYELGLICIQPERALSLTSLTFVWLLKIASSLWDSVQCPTPLAFKGGLGDFWANICRFPNSPLNRDEIPVMLVA